MKVLHVQRVKGIGGSERHLLALLPALADAGFEVNMCVAATGQAEDFVARLRELGIPHHVVAAGADLSPPLVAALTRRIRAESPDLVHTHLVHADLHGQLAARAARVPGVSSVHGTPAFYRRLPIRLARRAAGRSAVRTIAISEHVRDYLTELRLSPAARIRVVPYGIEASDWDLTDDERTIERDRLGLGPDDVAIGMASRLIPGKGHASLLEAFARAAREAPNLRLLIAGDGPLREELAAAARAHGPAVVMLGFVADVRPLMSACDALAFPTQPELSEGFGLAALEAMAAGRPVVATDVGSLPEVVVAGETGFVVEPGDPDKLAEALVALAGDPGLRARMGECGRLRARSTFSLELMVERTMAVYAEALHA